MTLLKKLIPRSVKEAVKSFDRERRMRSAVEGLRRLPEGEAPTAALLSEFESAWGADGFRAVGGFLEEVTRRAALTPGPILEAGSGLTTLLMGLLAGRRGIQVYTLEHTQEFYEQTRRKLERNAVGNVNLALAPLRDYGEFGWYSPPSLEGFPRDMRLVVADGPPGGTKGGRFGLMPVMRPHMAADVTILLDDAERPEEQECLRRWREEYGVRWEMNSRGGKAWAVCTLGS
ncbi:MAG TPA: hypothetical protein VM914_09375 [Pyrinomonadaceae bacterium]|jgi:hypothetical protein|nr:hypothetical protein [Pyrinomonadaceae bacterium]